MHLLLRNARHHPFQRATRGLATSRTAIDTFVVRDPVPPAPQDDDGTARPQSTTSLAEVIALTLKGLLGNRLDDDYIVHSRNIIGEGRFGVIRTCTKRDGTEPMQAVKTMYKVQCKRDPASGRFYEVAALERLPPNGFQLKRVYETPLKIHLVTELLHGTSVFHYLDERGWKKPRNDREEKQVARFIAGLVRGVLMLHEAGFAHLDVKFENFMFRNEDDAQNGVDPVLIDFGAARPLDGPLRVLGVVGSPSYAPPEMVLHGRFSETSDSWSLGVMAFTLLQGAFPFSKLGECPSDFKLYYCPIEWRRTSAEAQDFVRLLLDVDEHSRGRLREALNHPWLQQQDHHQHHQRQNVQ